MSKQAGTRCARSSATWKPATRASPSGWSKTANCTASSTSTSTTRTSGFPAAWTLRSPTATRSPSCRPSPVAERDQIRLAAGRVGQYAVGRFAAPVAALGRRPDGPHVRLWPNSKTATRPARSKTVRRCE
ncbi:sulfur carrier CysO domain protein [Mycobacterium xenopi 3993]|nr:sulfur carrier CysO domain protein [Mycobacterium xenopi 3993]